MGDNVLEYKSVHTAFKAAEGDAGEYDGVFSVFGNMDDGRDIVHPGAFAKTIKERGSRVRVLLGHDWDKLIGPPPKTLEEVEVGLHAAGHLTIKTFWGNETWELMKDDALNEGSFRYGVIKSDVEYPGGDETDWGDQVRNLRELKLYEISMVPLGMNPLTSVQAVKALLGMSTMPEGDIQVPSADDLAKVFTHVASEIHEGRAFVTAPKEAMVKVYDALQSMADELKKRTGDGADEPETTVIVVDHSALNARRLRHAAATLELMGAV